MSSTHPDFVGRYIAVGQSHFYAVKHDELNRAGHSAARVIDSFDIPPGRFILTLSLNPEIGQFGPFEVGMQMLGLFGTNADRSPYDTPRVEALVRMFDCAAICGVDKGTLDGLAMFKHDAAKIFAGRVVWALPDAYEAVAAMPGVIARRCAEIGPVLGLECVAGQGLHIDSRDWDVTDDGGTLHISSRAPRIQPFHNLDTGLKGRVVPHFCDCGNRDTLVVLD
jgi:hypothetical protein